MTESQRKMNLFLFHNPVGRNTSSWRREGSRIEEAYGLPLAAYSAQRAEAAKLDAIFLADILTFGSTGKNPDLTAYEPFTLMGALAAVTTRIGIIATASTTFIEPYHLARYFSQLDWLSAGRAGWNIVTSSAGDENFQAALPARSERYARAEEHLRIVTALWDAWDDDAVINDRERGIWADNSKIHPVNIRSEHFRVEGPLLVPRSPQGWPVLAQAGQSDEGIAFAAKYAEAVFTAQNDIELARTYYTRLKSQTAQAGRDPNKLKILPGLVPIIGKTRADAEALSDELADLLLEEDGISELSRVLADADLSGLELGEPIPRERLVPPDQLPAGVGSSRYINFYKLAIEEKLTLRELSRERTKTSGHGGLAGTAEDVADRMQHWFETGAADGFTLSPPFMPEGLDAICDELVPLLQDRGLFRTEYEGETLRDTLGLDRPVIDRSINAEE